MSKMIAIAVILLAVPAFAQVGGNGVARQPGGNGGTLGYNQTQTPHGLNQSSLCTGAPLNVNGQVRRYIVLYDQAGQPYSVPGC